MSFVIAALLVFAFGVVFDALYVLWLGAAVVGHAVRAAALGAVITTMSAVGVLYYVADWRLIFPSVAGHALGSYLGVKYPRWKAQKAVTA